ncbi:acetyl-CoA carboxylase biotin carboxyl carrier protein [Chengkuizengella axinellae]|uniref:Biotin carboxyl carrier protein of acetyl-CoA carboxylase n=1 Tax=Chengkuizengella axinellae TaxID=3064388 RepID=A0ABT9IXR5_9BACL|nr:acetyl-CoA carboxylase biotin carboxyl carrier protein [Chengkuizengella sp. 2205SS18-9]MDP5273599.1 acetyl-CoA carboxylase biotin carboxyl carrier protein [Chengkuizengella sp. 2205SS18-9]
MFKLNEIKELVRLVDKSTLQELEIENEGARLLIRKPASSAEIVPQIVQQTPIVSQPAVQQAPQTQQPAAVQESPAEVQPTNETEAQDANLHKITSPMVGTFYIAPSPGADPFVKKGDKVTNDTVVCIVEAMKLMNEIEAEIKGEIVEILVEDGHLVEFGQPLFLVKPE